MQSNRDGCPDAAVRSRTRLAVVVVLLAAAALAGCNALTGDRATGTPSAVEGTSATAEGTERPVPSLAAKGVDVAATWNRTRNLVGVNATRPSVDVVGDPPTVTPPSFLAILTDASADEERRVTARYDPRSERVILYAHTVRESNGSVLETILAHEYVHAIQDQHGWGARDYPRTGSTEPMVARTYAEGFASYVEARYVQRHPELASARGVQQRFQRASTGERFLLSSYVDGKRYFARVVNETGSLAAAPVERPESTEQILHDTDESPRPLDVDAESGLNWSVDRGRPVGELLTRIVLRDELPADRAASAAAGWGADSLHSVTLRGANESGYVWVHRWDSSAEGEEFATAMNATLDARRGATDHYRFRLRRLTPETTALVFGTPGVVERTSLTAASNASVTIDVQN